MVGPELIGDTLALTAPPELVGVVFHLGAAIGKDQVIASMQVAIQVVCNCSCGRPEVFCLILVFEIIAYGSFCDGECLSWSNSPVVAIPLDDEFQLVSLGGPVNDVDLGTLPGPQVFGSQNHVPKCRGEANSGDTSSGCTFQTMQERLNLFTPLRANEGVKLVDHHAAGLSGQLRNQRSFIDEERLKRFWSDDENAGQTLQESLLEGRRDIAMPAQHRQIHQVADRCQTLRLVVDKSFEWTDGKNEAAVVLWLYKSREQREERSFGFPCRGCSGEDDIFIPRDQWRDRIFLYGPETRPALGPDPVLNPFVELLKRPSLRA